MFINESVIERTAAEEALVWDSPGAAGIAVVGRFGLIGGWLLFIGGWVTAKAPGTCLTALVTISIALAESGGSSKAWVFTADAGILNGSSA